MKQIITDIGYQPGQGPILGIAGTAVEPVMGKGNNQIFYVDPGHANANDNNYGTDPNAPMATLQGLITRTTNYMAGTTLTTPVVESYDTIYVMSSLEESVVTGNYDVMPSYVTIAGIGPSRYSPVWQSAAADEIALDLRCLGWRITGFRFYGKASAPCIELHHTDLGGNDIAIRTIIDHNYFDGQIVGETGIESHGCYDVWVTDNTFSLWNNAGNTAAGMRTTTTPLAIPYRNHVARNMFYDNDNNMIWSSNGSLFYDNIVQSVGYAYSAVQSFQTSTIGNVGDDNMVTGNYFSGDYSIAGGYRGGAADQWFGNYSPDIAEAEVADNGLTILPPA